ncbi:hypothetical protein BDF21DRAFT_369401 [Thamnidium elegans]|nr:hypothetical protein BDF21DRAFT_369401 [Thamnidium elegans]
MIIFIHLFFFFFFLLVTSFLYTKKNKNIKKINLYMSCCNTTLINQNTSNNITLINMSFIKPLNLQGGQCSWCGKYGHKRPTCPLLK